MNYFTVGEHMRSSHRTPDLKSLEYLAYLVAKYNLNPTDFIDALLSVSEQGKTTCGLLSIECREHSDLKSIFLLTFDNKVVSQFSLNNKLFETPDIMKKKFINIYEEIRLKNRYTYNPVVEVKINDLRVGTKNVKLRAEVLDKSPSKRVLSRNGKELLISNVIISDETGNITLPLWNEQIDLVSKGDKILIENASVRRYRGERQLNIGYKRGKINILN